MAEKDRTKTMKNNYHQKKIEQQNLVASMQKIANDNLLPDIKEKAEKVSEYIKNELEKDIETEKKGLSVTKIHSLITHRSMSELATAGNKSFTIQELAIALNIYIEMINEINKYTKFPPSKGSFCMMLGISTITYNNYLQDPEKCEIMRIIDDYITTTIISSAQLGEIREIMTMFSLKTLHGFIEAQAPTVIEHKSSIDIDDIQAQLSQLKKGKVVDADWEEISNKKKQ